MKKKYLKKWLKLSDKYANKWRKRAKAANMKLANATEKHVDAVARLETKIAEHVAALAASKNTLTQYVDVNTNLQARIAEHEAANADTLTFNVWRDKLCSGDTYTLRPVGHEFSTWQRVGTAQACKTDKHASAWQAHIEPGIAFAIVATDDVYEVVSVALHEDAEAVQPGCAPEIAEANVISMPIWHNPDSDMYTVSPTDNIAHHVKVGTANVRLIDENLEGWSVKMWSSDLLIIGAHFRHETSVYEVVSVHEDAKPHDGGALTVYVYRLNSGNYFASETPDLEEREPCTLQCKMFAREVFGENFATFHGESLTFGAKTKLASPGAKDVVLLSTEDA